MAVNKKLCSRCNKWHQRLLHCWDNMEQKETLICLSCIAEIITGRVGTEYITRMGLSHILEE